MNLRLLILGIVLGLGTLGQAAAPQTPILYSTDLFHPPLDPDDHYDLACLFAMAELDIRGIVLDVGERQEKEIGLPPVTQMMHITGRKAPVAVGLNRPLRDGKDRAEDVAEKYQAGVRLLLSALRDSKDKVIIFTTGSCRDLTAAYNREPALMRQKVKAVYFNIGRGPNEKQDEWNVGYDQAAYVRLFESGLPLYWCPCFGKDGYETYYVAPQTPVVGASVQTLQNYFIYALTKSQADPIAFLSSGAHPLPAGDRNMWCTAPMVHAAGRQIYQRGENDYVALQPSEAKRLGLANQPMEVFTFAPIKASIGGPFGLQVELSPAQANGWVFRRSDARYQAVMASCLKNLLSGVGR